MAVLRGRGHGGARLGRPDGLVRVWVFQGGQSYQTPGGLAGVGAEVRQDPFLHAYGFFARLAFFVFIGTSRVLGLVCIQPVATWYISVSQEGVPPPLM